MTRLAAGELESTWLPEHGMVGASLTHRGEELLGQRKGLDAYVEKGSAFGIPLLAPWANRLDGLTYGEVTIDPARVKGGDHGLPKDGVLANRPFTVQETTATSLTASFTSDDDVHAVFPFPFALTVAVSLTPAALTVSTALAAATATPVPVAFGWHPLFTLPGTAREALHVELPVSVQTVLDARGIPVEPTEHRQPAFRSGTLAPDQELDDEYPALTGDFVLRDDRRELRVVFGPGTGYPVGHAWAPRGEDFVAWEPMTAPTNALKSGHGLRHVSPGDTFVATFTVLVASR